MATSATGFCLCPATRRLATHPNYPVLRCHGTHVYTLGTCFVLTGMCGYLQQEAKRTAKELRQYDIIALLVCSLTYLVVPNANPQVNPQSYDTRGCFSLPPREAIKVSSQLTCYKQEKSSKASDCQTGAEALSQISFKAIIKPRCGIYNAHIRVYIYIYV